MLWSVLNDVFSTVYHTIVENIVENNKQRIYIKNTIYKRFFT